MHNIRLNDQLFKQVQLRAAEAGYATVDEYIVEVLSHDIHDATENLDHLFTPERLAHIDRAQALIESGSFYTGEQADLELANRRAEWLRRNPR
jgi:hypothetical protein